MPAGARLGWGVGQGQGPPSCDDTVSAPSTSINCSWRCLRAGDQLLPGQCIVACLSLAGVQHCIIELTAFR